MTSQRGARFGLAPLLLLPALLAGCGAPQKTRPPHEEASPPPKIEPPLQDVAQVHLIGFRETLGKRDDSPFPAPGFRLEGNRIAPTSRVGSAVGTRMTAGAFAALLKSLAEDRNAVIYMAPVFTVHPGRDAVAAGTSETAYLSNYLFDPKGGYASRRDKLVTGARVKVRPMPTGAPDTVLVKIELSLQSGKVEWRQAADGFRDPKAGRAPPLRLQLPTEAARRLRAAVRVPYGHSVVAAHYVKQYRQRPSFFGSRKRVREHLLCVVTAARSAKPPVPDSPAPAREATRCYATTLLWADAPIQRPGRPTGTRRLEARRVRDEQVAAALKRLAVSEDMVAITIGMATTPGLPSSFEVTDTRAYVAGTSVASGPGKALQRGFEIRKATAGVAFAPRIASPGRLLDVRLGGRLASRFSLRPFREERLSLRAPPSEGIKEMFHLSECDQVSADLYGRFRCAPGDTQELGVPWRRRNSTADGDGPDWSGRVVFFSAREMP